MRRVHWRHDDGREMATGRRPNFPWALCILIVCCGPLFMGCRKKSSSSIPNLKDVPAKNAVDEKKGLSGATDESPSGLAFEEMNEQSGIAIQYDDGSSGEVYSIVESVGGGLGVFDYDLDGQLDLIYSGGGVFDKSTRESRGRNGALYRGAGSWKFTNSTAAARIDMSPHYNHAIASADYNGDGFQDFLVTGFTGMMLFENQGDGTFQEVASKAGLLGGQAAASALWADFNGDSHLDLYVTTYTTWSFENNPPCVYPKGGRDLCGPREFSGANDFLYLSNGEASFWEGIEKYGIREGG